MTTTITAAAATAFQWPSTVYILEPGADGDRQAQQQIDEVFATNGGHDPACHGQFSEQRFALLFKPGTHHVNVNVGYYTSVMGLGLSPRDTVLDSLTSPNGDFNYEVGALNNFWRSAENLTVSSKVEWAVSQAAPMRRCVVNDLSLYQWNAGQYAGFASGGFLADSVVNGTLTTGSQQQWLTRNTKIGACGDALWNMVYVGATGGVPATRTGAPTPTQGNPMQTTTITSTPVIAEKPYVAFVNGGYVLCVPAVETNKSGPTEKFDTCMMTQYGFEHVFVATPLDSAAAINSKLDAGQHVILTPGVYSLDAPLVIQHPDTVLLGLGFPTLVAARGNACIRVATVPGVRVAGVLLQAGPYGAGQPMSQVLLQWGDPRSKASPLTTAANPGVMSDVFARVGGPNDPAQQPVGVDTMVRIWSSHVIVDNTWLWRADHGVAGLVKKGDNPCMHAIVVDGDAVTAYGLAVEHTLQDPCVWNGNEGQTYFFQCEYPYDVPSPWPFVGYHVADTVTSHLAYGVGVYSFFRDYSVQATTGIRTPTALGVQFVNSFTRFLDGQGGIEHVINDKGGAVKNSTVEADKLAYVDVLQSGLMNSVYLLMTAPYQRPSYANANYVNARANAKPDSNAARVPNRHMRRGGGSATPAYPVNIRFTTGK